MNTQNLTCPWSAPIFFLFSTDPGVPSLLYYAYIPIIFATLFFSIFIFVKDNYSPRSSTLLFIGTFFTCSIINNIFEWTSNNPFAQMFSWQINAIFELPISLFSVYFVDLFLENKNNKLKIILVALFLPVIFLLATPLNVREFYLTETDCGGVFGILWTYIYGIELISVLTIAYLCIHKYFSTEDKSFKLQIAFLGVGSVLFLGIFFASNVLGDITKTYSINLIGPIGMILFLGTLSYMIVKFKTFNTKLFTSQLLVVSLLFLIASFLLIQRIDYIRIVVLFTFGLVSIIGLNLIRSVKKEIEQREKIEKLAVELENANAQLRELDRQKDELLSIVSHQFATPVSALKWNFEMMLDGDDGKLSKKQEENVKSLQNITNDLSDLVSMILDVSRVQLGRMKMDRQELDLDVFFKEILEVIEPKAEQKKVKFVVSLPKKFPKALLDKRYTRMTIENLLSNAVKYTPANGDVHFDVKIKDKTMYCEVKDTGVGIPKDDQDKIFGKQFRASNVRNEVDGNGFGLYVAKGSVEAQGGKIWFKSEQGKGTTFFVELPLNFVEAKDVD